MLDEICGQFGVFFAFFFMLCDPKHVVATWLHPISLVEDEHQATRRHGYWRLKHQRAIGYWIEGEAHELWIGVVV